MPLILFAFLLVPVLEIYLLIEIGSALGASWTVTLVVATAVAGAALVRRQGLATLARFRAAVEQEELPALALAEGVVLLVAGALLLTPGFFTDAVGFACLVPPLRRLAIAQLLARAIGQNGGRPGGAAQAPRTVEGEYRSLDD
ncbi:MAG: FxsA family protein [Arenicellales bacterium]|nr:FxsA family protein [Arenicellales bacterium]